MTDQSRNRPHVLAVGALSAAAVALVLTGCGSSNNSAGGSNSPTPSSSSSSAGGGQTIATSTGSAGTYLTGDGGRAVYLWEGDHGGMSSCSSACASVWPPVTTSGAPKAGAGVNAADLGTIHRSDGSTQVTYDGHPLYYFASDNGAGQTNGQGSSGFGAKWWLVGTSGAALMGTGGGGSSPSPTTSGGGGGYGGY